MRDDLIFGFLGAGKMATALARGFVAAGLAKPAQLLAGDLYPAAREQFARDTGGTATDDNEVVVAKANLIVLAVKPGHVGEALASIRPHFRPEQLLISIAAGVGLDALKSHLPANARVVRVMPNTPALVGASASAFAVGSSATTEDAGLVRELFSAVGLVAEVKEDLLDAVTGLSGSGPAYVYQFIEALSDGGVAAGLPRELATKLAAQTVMGAAKMVLETGVHPGALKDMVTSPAGTTIAGVHQLELGGLRGTVMNAVLAATERSRELGEA